MTIFYTLKKLAAVLLGASLLLNCSGKPEATASHSRASKSYAKEAKPGAPVKLVSGSSIAINSAQPTQIIIELETSEFDGSLDIDFVPGNGLDILDTATHQTVNLSNTPSIKFPVTLIAHTDGRYYLNMHIQAENSESSSSRTLALIVQAGAEADEKSKLKKTPGENVISLPAHEKIYTR